jgi:hypothetical protein
VAEARQRLHDSTDEALAGALRDLGSSVAFPSAAAAEGQVDIAARARIRIMALDVRPSTAGRRRFGFGPRPMRRGLVLALAALLILAAIVGAVGLGLPGLRIIFGEPPSPRPSPSASPSASTSATSSPSGALGSDLGLGSAMPSADLERQAGFHVVFPSDPAIGPPDVAYLNGQRVTLVWAVRPGLPVKGAHGVGLLISEFPGRVDTGYYEKILGSGTKVTPVKVAGLSGYWISGPPHFFYYIDPSGNVVEDAHQEVGDVLIWSTGAVTYRLESGLDMAGAIRIAETLK